MPPFFALLTLLPGCALANWQVEQANGQGDPLGMVLFFFAILAYVIVRDAYKQSQGKGWLALLTCLGVAWLIATYAWALWVACLVFLISFLQFCWTKIK